MDNYRNTLIRIHIHNEAHDILHKLQDYQETLRCIAGPEMVDDHTVIVLDDHINTMRLMAMNMINKAGAAANILSYLGGRDE